MVIFSKLGRAETLVKDEANGKYTGVFIHLKLFKLQRVGYRRHVGQKFLREELSPRNPSKQRTKSSHSLKVYRQRPFALHLLLKRIGETENLLGAQESPLRIQLSDQERNV
ncbi:hypothetical protein NPIL_68461 [Nephila pilipes]|uniref:Uncharacterized protein n=1 Tax=Nephila pilipes TaxID=299642 RepID=A0A8X6U250_NEPPI|nr:hypothetical protein NPIL_68461 [Nephila pilipes]